MASSGCAFSFAVRAARVEALACWFEKHAWVQGGGRESPRRARYFSLLRQRKVPKRKATPSLRPLRCAKRQTCVGAVAGCAAELTSRWRATFKQLRRARPRCGCVLRHIRSPRTRPDAGAASRGGDPNSQHPNIRSGHRCARPSLCSARRLRPRGGAERSVAKQWPEWMFAPQPLCMRRGAQRAGWHVCRRTHMLRGLARRSCLNGAPKARSEFCDAPRSRAPQVAPARSAGDADSGVAFSLVAFFWRSKRKPLSRRATPGLRPETRHAVSSASEPQLRQIRDKKKLETTKTIAASA